MLAKYGCRSSTRGHERGNGRDFGPEKCLDESGLTCWICFDTSVDPLCLRNESKLQFCTIRKWTKNA